MKFRLIMSLPVCLSCAATYVFHTIFVKII